MSKKTETLQGLIKWYNSTKGYGFIKMEDNKPDFFFHITNLLINDWIPEKDDKVKFIPKETEQGKYADDVAKIE